MGATVVFLLYCGMIASVPVLLFSQSAIGGGIVSIFAAVAMAIVAATSVSRDLYRLPRVVSPVLLAGLAGAFLVMLLQILPLPGDSLMHPIWSSAAAAVGEKPAGSVTIDTGMTLLVLCRLTCMVAVALLAALLGQHRRRAERLLWALAGIATLVSLEQIASPFWLPEAFQFLPPTARGAAETISIFGFVLAVAVIIRRYDSPPTRSKSRRPRATFTIDMAALAACLINLGAVVGSGNATTLFAALLGGGLLVAVLVIRKGRLSPWGQAGTAAVLALALATFVAFMPGRAESEMIVRMTDDARLLGVGAGTLAALAPIYGDALAGPPPEIPLVATVAIEMGRPFLWLIALIATTWAAIVLRASLMRGRDYVYPAAGAGCIAALLISALSNGGGLALASSVILSAVLGLAIAQSKGETAVSDASTAGLAPAAAPDPRSFQWYVRSASAVFGLILTVQGAWILLPEALRPTPIGFPNDERHATVARQDKERATRSAAIAAVRGDLWAESAFSEAGMVWTDEAFELEASGARNAATLKSLLQTLHYAPHRGDAWLMLASTCERLKRQACNVGALLKMSYYTAPNQAGLLSLRLAQALRAKDISSDEELADMVRRDVRLVVTRFTALRPALIAAYRSGSPSGRRLVEQTVTSLDPVYLTILRAQLT